MSPSLRHTSGGSSKDTAPTIQPDVAEHVTPRVASEDNAEYMPRGAAEHADFLQNSYVGTTILSAWTMTNVGLISLSRLQQHIERETHVPLTLNMLLHAKPQQTKSQNISWIYNLESVSRCVASYHHAFGASEHD